MHCCHASRKCDTSMHVCLPTKAGGRTAAASYICHDQLAPWFHTAGCEDCYMQSNRALQCRCTCQSIKGDCTHGLNWQGCLPNYKWIWSTQDLYLTNNTRGRQSTTSSCNLLAMAGFLSSMMLSCFFLCRRVGLFLPFILLRSSDFSRRAASCAALAASISAWRCF